jgi:predicted membrane-bound spermidine synthase/Flp pilus assembly protein TadD
MLMPLLMSSEHSCASCCAALSPAMSVSACVAAAVAGVATLAYEVLAARMATLQLGSSLYAWAVVLAMFLVGLAGGNLCWGSRAARTGEPERDLGWIEVAAAVVLAAGLVAIAPSVATPAAGLTARALLVVALGVLPPAFLMGAAFPFFVRLALGESGPGTAFGAVSAANTAGGIAGALLAPFAFLPALGPRGGTLACAGLVALVGLTFLARATRERPRGRGLLMAAAAVLAAAGVVGATVALPSDSRARARVIHVQHGRQATVAVVVEGDRRDLYVDGDPEASTAGAARDSEEFLAALPLLLHEAPGSFLEIGLGSGITLGTASRFPLRRIECVEIAASVVGAAPFFAPDNAEVASGRDPRVRLVRSDGRGYLLRRAAEYDIVVANTLHPWSVGATGLYSRQYFARLAGALRPGGIAVQWLPVGHIGAENLAAVLRTFYAAFETGVVWWGAENLMLVGSDRPSLRVDPQRFQEMRPRVAGVLRRLGVTGARELNGRRLADAEAVRAALGPGEVLSDDRPILEARAARGRASVAPAAEFALLEEIAQAGNRADPELGAMLLWIQSRAARARGEGGRGDRLEQLAEAAGLVLARRSRARRVLSEASGQLAAGRLDQAERSFERILTEMADDEAALLGLGVVALEQRRLDDARDRLERLLALRPDHAEGWNLLGITHRRRGEAAQAERAFASALRADPFFPEALANAGLLAAKRGDAVTAREMLARLRAMSRGQSWPEERTLAEALAGS